jgi:hypothetical protein
MMTMAAVEEHEDEEDDAERSQKEAQRLAKAV